MMPACPRNGNAIPNPEPLADVVQAINHSLFMGRGHPLAASEMLATSQAALADAENRADVLRGPFGRNPSTQRSVQTSVQLQVFLQLLVVACFAVGIGISYCSINSLNAVQKDRQLQLQLFKHQKAETFRKGIPVLQRDPCSAGK